MIKLKYGASVISLPGAVKDKISEAGEAELRVLVALCAGNSEGELASVCSLDGGAVSKALSFWRGAGIIEGEEEPMQKRRITPSDSTSRVYTGDEIAKIRESDPSVDGLIIKCREILGSHVFTHAESSSVIYLRQGLGLEPEYIMLLCSHYARREKITVRFIEKKAISLYDGGIRTVDALEAYLDGENKKHDVEYLVRRLFGLGERALVPREREYISNWVKWGMSEEMIRRAYEETISNTERPTLAYANAIMDNWHKSGVSNGAEAEEKKKEFKEKSGKKSKKQKNDPGFDLDEFLDLAIARGESNIGK